MWLHIYIVATLHVWAHVLCWKGPAINGNSYGYFYQVGKPEIFPYLAVHTPEESSNPNYVGYYDNDIKNSNADTSFISTNSYDTSSRDPVYQNKRPTSHSDTSERFWVARDANTRPTSSYNEPDYNSHNQRSKWQPNYYDTTRRLVSSREIRNPRISYYNRNYDNSQDQNVWLTKYYDESTLDSRYQNTRSAHFYAEDGKFSDSHQDVALEANNLPVGVLAADQYPWGYKTPFEYWTGQAEGLTSIVAQRGPVNAASGEIPAYSDIQPRRSRGPTLNQNPNDPRYTVRRNANDKPCQCKCHCSRNQPNHRQADTAPLRDLTDQQVQCTTAEGFPGYCRRLDDCPTDSIADYARLSRSPCRITPTRAGVCCPTAARIRPAAPQQSNAIFSPPPQPVVQDPNLTRTQVDRSCNDSLQEQRIKTAFVRKLKARNIVARKGSPVHLHARLFQTTRRIVEKSQDATLVLGATNSLVKSNGLTKPQAKFSLPTYTVKTTIISSTCPAPPACPPEAKYRSADGSCNSLKDPEFGQAGTAFYRLLPAEYADGMSSIRRSVDGSELPSPRSLSSSVVVNQDDLYQDFTLLLMQWGQFLDHDITHTPISKGSGMTDITCCEKGRPRPRNDTHPECLAIPIPLNDKFYRQFNQVCMEFVRSMPAIRRDCSFGPREQMNQITAFIDGSNVYGSSADEMTALREGEGGRMEVAVRGGRHYLPGTDHDDNCDATPRNRPCFHAGDSRVNEQPNLVVLHMAWMRQHNLIADGLQQLNPNWDDETLFHEARRIVEAQMQHITYNEFLPIILGKEFMEHHDLSPVGSGYSTGYRQDVDPTISNAFATAAFRYGHTLISSQIRGYDKFGLIERNMNLSRTQFSPFFLYEEGSYDSLIRGLTLQSSQKFDNLFSEELTNHLFAKNAPFGMDLVALNIQRGRDHGLPPYTSWRVPCNLPKATSFDDLIDVMDKDAIHQLRHLYRSVDDIDLFVGGMLERSLLTSKNSQSLLGETFLCIVGDQFSRLKFGDRFYYEHGNVGSRFTEQQLTEIRRTSLARVLCDNADDLKIMQPVAFVRANVRNRRVWCEAENLIDRMSLEPWREN